MGGEMEEKLLSMKTDDRRHGREAWHMGFIV